MPHQPTETLDRSVIASFREGAQDGAPDIVVMLIDQFLLEAESQTDRLREAARCGDAATVKAAAHSLKGSALTMGANKLGLLSAAMEAGAASRPSADGVALTTADLMLRLDRELIQVRTALMAEREGVGSV